MANFEPKQLVANEINGGNKYRNLVDSPQADAFNRLIEAILYAQQNGASVNITIDNELSSTSENPVQNKVINAELEKKLDINSPTTIGYPSYLYGYSGSNQKTLRYNVQGGVGGENFNQPNMIVVTQGTGQVKGNTPIELNDLTPKKYVDDTKADKEITHNGWKKFSGDGQGAPEFTVRTGIEYNPNAYIKGKITTISELSPDGVYKTYSYYCKASDTLTFDDGFAITFSQGASYEDELRCETNGYVVDYSLSILTELTEDLHKVVKDIEKDTIANESKIANLETDIDKLQSGTYELIDTITTTEGISTISLSNEPNGKAYSFKDIFIKFKWSASLSNKWVLLEITSGGNKVNGFRSLSFNGANGTSWIRTVCLYGHRLFLFSDISTNLGNSFNIFTPLQYQQNDEPISAFTIQHQEAFPLGTVIEIWGVRA